MTCLSETHDLREPGNQCVLLDPALATLLSNVADLTDFGVVFRYVDAPREPDCIEAGDAIEAVRPIC